MLEQIVGALTTMLKPTAPRLTQPFGHRLRKRPADAAEACIFLREWFLVLVLSFFPSHFNIPPRRGGLQKSSLLRRFLEPRFAPSTSSAQIIGICLYAAMRSAGASLWRLTIPPFLPRMGDSFFREERSKEQTKSTGADSVCGPLSAAHPAAPESGKKCYWHLKFRAVIPARYAPALPGRILRPTGFGKFAKFPQNPVPARCLTDIRISSDEGAITQAQSDPKRGITPCPSSGRLYVRRNPADPVTFF